MNISAKKTIKDPEIYNQTRHRDQGYNWAALFILALGLEQGAAVVRQLPEQDAACVLQLIAGMGEVPAKDVRKVCIEFGYEPEQGYQPVCGGDAVVEQLRSGL